MLKIPHAAYLLLLMLAAPPIATRVDEVVDVLHGVEVKDPYRWLEDSDSPEVRAWTDAQNALTRKLVDAVPGRKKLEERLWRYHEIGALGSPVVRGKGTRRRYFYSRRDGKQNQPALYVRDGVDGADRAVIDVNTLAADGTVALDWWYPSDDGKLLAYGVSSGGDEQSTLRIREVDTGRDLPDVITRARACSVAFRPDNKGFWYTRYPARGQVPTGEEEYHRHVYYHALGTDPEKDPHVFGRGRDLKDWPGVSLSPNGRWLVVEVSQGWAKSEVYVADTRRKGAPRFVPVAAGPNALFQVAELLNDRIFIHTNEGAPRYRLYAVDPRRPARAAWKEVLSEGPDTLETVDIARGRIAAVYLKDASSRVRLFSLDGKPEREIALPGLGTVSGISSAWDGDEIFYAYVSFLTTTVVYRADLLGGTEGVWKRLESPVDSGAFEISQVRFPSKDGTQVPMFLVHKKGLVRDGKNPTLLYGYGGFNINQTPAFASSIGPFLEKGGVYAMATLRGGGEYGEEWHRAGMLERKQNVFDDFIAAAEYLISSKTTSRDRLAIAGRSNGGLLVGAALTQRPDLFRAVICGVPLLDMVRYHRFRIAKLWIPEYGSPDEPGAFKWLHAYSPYHRVRQGTAYPAVLFTTAEGDSRVDPMHARKMAARLQAATNATRPVLLRIETRAGHGAGKPLGKIISQLTDEWSFLFRELGMANL